MQFSGVFISDGGFQVTSPITPVLLLHFDGPSDPAFIVDSSCNNAGFTLSAPDGIALSAFAKFGTASLLLPGGPRYIFTSDGCVNGGFLDLRNGDFTAEGWFFRENSDGSDRILINYTGQGFDQGWSISTYGNPGPGLVRIAAGLYGPNKDGAISEQIVSLNSWVHWALVRNGNNVDLFLNGVKAPSTATVTGQWGNSVVDALRIGGSYLTGNPQLNAWVGYQDEIRITKAAIYTSNFTPPSAPFPDPSC